VILSFADSINAAQREDQTEETKKNKQESKGLEQLGTLTINVSILEPDKEPRAAARVMVHVIKGGGDPQQTDENGRATLLGIRTGKATLQVSVLGLPACNMAINVAGGNQVIRVLVEKGRQISCKTL
jgi:hypothetical protein